MRFFIPIDSPAARAAHALRRALTGSGLLLLLALLALLLAGRAARAQAPAAGAGPSVGTALNPDGTVRPGTQGAFNAAGYQLSYGKGGQPVLQRTTAGDAWNVVGGSPAGTQNGVGGDIYTVAISGPNVYVGGSFTAAGGVAANNIAQWNGTTWSSVGTGAANGTSGSVNALAVSGTTVYAAGSFSTAGGITANSVARWDGTAWSALGTGALTQYGTPGSVLALALSANGTDVYIGGSFDKAGGMAATNVAHWDGSTWSPMGTGMNSNIYSLAVSGSTVYAGGYFTTAGGVAANRIAKWDGTDWSALGSGLGDYVKSVAVSGSTVYAAGAFTTAGGVSARYVAQWDGSAWSALGGGMDNLVEAIAVSGSTVYAAGQFTNADGAPANRIAQWNGSAWSPLGTGAANGTDSGISGLAVSGTTVYAGGRFAAAGGNTATHVAQWSGSTWSPLGTGTAPGVTGPQYSSVSVNSILVNGTSMYIAGSFTSVAGVAANGIAKWNGSTWSALGAGVSSVSALALAPNGTDLYVGGYFYMAGSISANRIAKWDGTAWSALGSGLSGSGYSIGARAMTISNGLLYVAGKFNNVSGTPANNIAVWNGSTWSALGTGLSVGMYDSGVSSMVVSGTDVYVAGDFTSAGGNSSIAKLAKWDGATWSALGSGISGSVSALALSGSTLYAAGYFTTAGGTPANNVAKWDGSAWSALGSGLGNGASALLLDGTDLYVGGQFTTAGGNPANHVAKWDGTAWTSLGTGAANGIDSNGSVYAFAINGRNLYVGGSFATAGGLAANNIAYYGAALAAPLPVELTAFTAAPAGPAAVRLAWATASEKNSARFEVERSLDDHTFARIGTVAAAGSSNTPQAYELLDTQPLSRSVTLYYRLKQVDLDGTFSYSPVRTVALPSTTLTGAKAILALFPNPAKTGATLTGAVPGTVATVFDALGRQMTSAKADAAGMATLALPAGLPAGVYVVRAGNTALRLTVE
ncbi:hypothetical protein GCM10028824_33540 [Hymenobacter segetis]|uniref:Rax2-like C-terminal domain-containing protein n=1 Tax=Hymenobacter segetis TaxID=2025509 RepID=A0ABU9LZW5_9BACT